MDQETMGTVISVKKQWWLKINTKPVRTHALDGAIFPHIIKVQYTVDGKTYTNPYDLSVSSNPVINNTDGSVIGYKYFNFDHTHGNKGLKIVMDIVPLGVQGRIDIYVGNPKKDGIKVGSITLKKNMKQGMTEAKAKAPSISKLSGKQPLFFAISSDTPGASICEIHHFGFE